MDVSVKGETNFTDAMRRRFFIFIPMKPRQRTVRVPERLPPPHTSHIHGPATVRLALSSSASERLAAEAAAAALSGAAGSRGGTCSGGGGTGSGGGAGSEASEAVWPPLRRVALVERDPFFVHSRQH